MFFCAYRLPMIIGIDESRMGRVTSPLADAGKIALPNHRAQEVRRHPGKCPIEGVANCLQSTRPAAFDNRYAENSNVHRSARFTKTVGTGSNVLLMRFLS